jgi:hypothetical protein
MKVHQRLAARSIRLPWSEIEMWREAAGKLNITKSAFFRLALREKATAVIEQARWAERDRKG